MDISSVITTAVADVGPEFAVVAAAGLGIGVTLYGIKRAWGLFKGFAK